MATAAAIRRGLEAEAIRDVLKRRHAEKRLERYQPHPKQAGFHGSAALTRLLEGGNRSGKSTAGIAEDIAYSMGERPWDGTRTIDVPNKGLICAPDFANSHKRTTVSKLKELAPPSFFRKIVKGQHGVECEFYCSNGSVIFLGSYDQNVSKFESADWDYIHYDEPPPRDIYIALKRGLIDRQGRSWFTMTPLAEPWVFDEIHSQAGIDPTIERWVMDIRDNPHISEEAIQEFEKSLTSDEQEARLHGKWMHLTGLIYKEWDRDVHIIKDKDIPNDWEKGMPPADWPRGCVVDPHDRRPFAIGWFAVSPEDTIYFYDEWPEEPFHEIKSTSYILDDYVRIIRDREKMHRGPIKWRILDPNFGKTTNVRTGLTLQEELAMRKLYFDCEVDDSIQLGHLKVKQALRFLKDKPIDVLNSPKMYVLERCWNTVFGMEHYQWDDWRNATEKGWKEKPKQRYKDFPDLVRYTAMYNPMFKSNLGVVMKSALSGTSGYGM